MMNLKGDFLRIKQISNGEVEVIGM